MRAWLGAGSLGARVLRQMAIRIAVVICLVTLASYWHVHRSVTATATETLAEYVRERGDRESQLFLLAEDNLKVLVRTFLKERSTGFQGRDERDFDLVFERSADGAWRRRAGFDVNSEPSSYIAARVNVDGETRREMLSMLELVGDFGRAWNNRFSSAWLCSMDGQATTYMPGVDWYTGSPADDDFTRYHWVRMVMPANNPERKLRWTGIWYDWVANSLSASGVLPVDIDGVFRYYAGTSVRLDNIIGRAREEGLSGTRNIIFRADGKLVSHPDDAVMAVLRKNKGEFSIQASGSDHLRAVYEAVVQGEGRRVLSLDAYGEYLGVARIAGPDWYFVSVLPKEVPGATAASTARIVLWLGLAALLLELAIVGWIIRRQVSRPLARVMERLTAFGEGQWGTRIEVDRADELGRLSRTFNQMAQALEDVQRRLREDAASLEAKVSERTRQLEEKDREKTRFLAAASHDLRQPIQAATLLIDHLKHSRLDDGQRRSVDYLDLSVRSVRELLDALLDVSRLDAGAVSPRLATFGVGRLCESIEAEFTTQALAKGLRLRCRFPRPDITVTSDYQLVTTILRNLVSNAVRYTERGGILIGARRRGGEAVLQVWDSGIGIHERDLGYIYEEFFQVGNPQRDRSKGFGLGLAIARRLADLLGCRLTCRSRFGRGTLFELALPRAGEGGEAPAPQVSPARQLPAGKRFVIVEDDPLVAESMARLLEAGGNRVSIYASAEQALADEGIAGADRYISDHWLPGAMDGIEFLDAIRARAGHDVSGILVTGDTSPEFIERARRSGWPVLFKPVDPALLLDALNG